jgi:hypothetical protein
MTTLGTAIGTVASPSSRPAPAQPGLDRDVRDERREHGHDHPAATAVMKLFLTEFTSPGRRKISA